MKRFYSKVDVRRDDEGDGGWRVLLDGRPIRTQGGHPQLVPTVQLAEAMATEWREQAEDIDPRSFPLRDMADHAIDIVRAASGQTVETVLAFAETDTLAYRADPEDALFAEQQRVWEPLVAALEKREGITMPRVSGIIHRPLAPATAEKLRQRLSRMDAFTLAGLHNLAALAASLTIALAVADDQMDAEAGWQASELETDWQARLWGGDPEAEARNASRRAGFMKAAQFLKLSRS